MFCCALALLPAALVAASQQAAVTDPVAARALAIHQRAITIDTHVDIGGADYATPALDPGAETTTLKCDLTKMEKGGLDGAFLAVYVGQGTLDKAGYQRAYDQAMVKFEALRRLTETDVPEPERVCEVAGRGGADREDGQTYHHDRR